MAIFTCELTPIKRSRGQSVVEAAAYATHTALRDLRTGETHNKIIHRLTDTVIDMGSFWRPGVAADPEALWNLAEAKERRRDSQTGRKIMIALPHELTLDQQKDITRHFMDHLMTAYGVACTAGIHLEAKHNPHAHLVISKRSLDDTGGFGAVTVLDDYKKGKDALKAIRQQWADICNAALEAAGHDARVSPLSYAAQGINRQPQEHQGVKRHAMALKRLGLTREEYSQEIYRQQQEALANARHPNPAHAPAAGGPGSGARPGPAEAGRPDHEPDQVAERPIQGHQRGPGQTGRAALDGRGPGPDRDQGQAGADRKLPGPGRRIQPPTSQIAARLAALEKRQDALDQEAASLTRTTPGRRLAGRITALRWQRALDHRRLYSIAARLDALRLQRAAQYHQEKLDHDNRNRDQAHTQQAAQARRERPAPAGPAPG